VTASTTGNGASRKYRMGRWSDERAFQNNFEGSEAWSENYVSWSTAVGGLAEWSTGHLKSLGLKIRHSPLTELLKNLFDSSFKRIRKLNDSIRRRCTIHVFHLSERSLAFHDVIIVTCVAHPLRSCRRHCC
jgi:hypothetical protein